MTNLKIGGAQSTVNTPVVREASAYAYANAIPPDEAHARVLARQAERWLAFAGERSRMTPRTVTAKALDSLAFSVLHGARSFAVPSKLTGTRAHQRRLWALVREGYRPFAPLALDTVTTDGIAIALDDEPLGAVQPKHIGWARPLIAFGLSVHLAKVTGSERDGYTLGANIVFGGVGEALGRLLDALGTPAHAGDGHAGDGMASAVPEVSPASRKTDSEPNTGRPLRLVVLPERESPAAGPDDVVLWRSIDGTPNASVPHVARHSPSGIEWGYGGSGPADLARSVLLALTDEATAERLYQRFKQEVIARVPFGGGVLQARDVRAWVAQQEAPHSAA